MSGAIPANTAGRPYADSAHLDLVCTGSLIGLKHGSMQFGVFDIRIPGDFVQIRGAGFYLVC
jgi:hypothetical protein